MQLDITKLLKYLETILEDVFIKFYMGKASLNKT